MRFKIWTQYEDGTDTQNTVMADSKEDVLKNPPVLVGKKVKEHVVWRDNPATIEEGLGDLNETLLKLVKVWKKDLEFREMVTYKPEDFVKLGGKDD